LLIGTPEPVMIGETPYEYYRAHAVLGRKRPHLEMSILPPRQLRAALVISPSSSEYFGIARVRVAEDAEQQSRARSGLAA
jgi:hypothetical protein